MPKKPTYEELEQRIQELEQESVEHKHTEKALRDSEDHLQSVFRTAPTGIGVVSDRVLKQANERICEMTGYLEEELIGQKARILYPSDEDYEYVGREKYKQISNHGTGVVETRWKRKDGFIIDVLLSSTPIELGDLSKGVTFTALDITERKKIDEALQKSEIKHKVMLKNVPGMVYCANPDWSAEIISGCEMISGYTAVELNSKELNWLSIVHPDDVERVSKVGSEFIRRSKELVQTYRIITKSGNIRWVEDRKISLVSKEGKFIGIDGIVFDITDRKLTEEALKKSEEKYRSIFENAVEGFFQSTPEGRFISVNPSFAEMLGYASPEELISNVTDIAKQYYVNPEDRRRYMQLLEKDGSVQHFEFKARCKDGLQIWVSNSTRAVYNQNGKLIRYEGNVNSITQRKQAEKEKALLEEQLRQAQKMEAIGTLAGGIAHDFNNILFPMFGYLEMVLEDVPKGNPLRGQLVEVLSGAKRARDLVKQILAFSRQSDHDMKPMKMYLVLKEALKLIKASLPSTIKITQNIQSDCGLVFAAPTQIHQIVMNLCTNAYHAMEETGGKLTVNLKEVELTVEDLKDTAMVPGKHISLTVADTGPGMEQRVIDRIFDPYFTTKEKGKGTGLGLAVVDGIIKSHGGHIRVYNEPGKGTAFKVYLSVIKPHETAQQVETDTPIQKGDERILLVDDQDMVAQMEKQMLERLGYHVTARISSTDALEVFRTQPDKFDIVITDMTMPNMTGDKLAGELIKIRSDVPIILCTGFSEMMSKEKATALGVKGFLMKPIVMKDLSSIVRDVLDADNEN